MVKRNAAKSDEEILATADVALCVNRELQAAHDQMMLIGRWEGSEYATAWNRYLAAGGNRTMIDSGIDNENWQRHRVSVQPCARCSG